MTRRNFLRGALLGAGGLLFYAVLRKVPLPVSWVPALKKGVRGQWQGDEFVLTGGNKTLRLNTTGGEVVEAVSHGKYSLSQIASLMSKRYRIPRHKAEQDINALMKALDRMGFLA